MTGGSARSPERSTWRPLADWRKHDEHPHHRPAGRRRHRCRLLGPQPGPQLPGVARLGPRAGLRPRPRAGAPRRRRPARRGRPTALRAGARRPDGSTPSPSPPRPAPTTGSRWQALQRGQARARREAAGRQRRRRPRRWSTLRGRAGPGPDDRPHLLLHAGRAEDARAGRRAASSARSYFVDSVRINLGLVQPDVDVLWDLAPHDLSILDFVLPGGLPTDGRRRARRRPASAPASACVGYLTLPLPDDGASRTCTSTGSARPRSARW